MGNERSRRRRQKEIPGWYKQLTVLIVIAALAAAFIEHSQQVNAADPPADSPPAQNPDLAGFDSAVTHWGPEIEAWSQTYGIPAEDIATIMQIESCGDPYAISPAGARGLFQVMPLHLGPGETVDQLFDPQFNADKGLSFFAELLKKSNGDVDKAFIGYSAGERAMNTSLNQLPTETKDYVIWGQMRNRQARDEILSKWFTSGGSSLCEQAHQSLGLP